MHGPLSDGIFACLLQSSPSSPVQENSCPLQLLKQSHVLLKVVHHGLSLLQLWKGEGGCVCPTLHFVGSLVLVPLCSGCFPEGTRRKLHLPFVDGSAGSRAVGADGGRSRVRWCVVG